MSTWLKVSTAVDIAFGPFLDSADGNTVESGLTITQPDIRLKKNAGAWAQKSAAQTLSHEEAGWYEIALSATDTDTLGILIVAVHESGALPVWREFMVVPAQVYDSYLSTDVLQVDVAQWLGTAPLALSSQHVQSIANGIGAGALGNAALTTDTGLKPIRSDICLGGANGSITLDVSASSVNDFYKGTRIYLTLGTGAGQSRICTAYNGTTKVATIEPNWITNPVNSATSFAIREDASTPAIATGGIAAASFAPNAIGDVALAPDVDQYQAKVWLVKQSTTMDQYGVTFYKNGTPLESGITDPVIDYVKKLSDGSILVNDAALTDQSNGDYYYGESTNKVVAGNIYMTRVTATIDGSTRFMKQQLGRDSA